MRRFRFSKVSLALFLTAGACYAFSLTEASIGLGLLGAVFEAVSLALDVGRPDKRPGDKGAE